MKAGNKIFYLLFVLNIPLIGIISFMLALFFDGLVAEIIIYVITLLLTIAFSLILFKVGKKSKLVFYILSILTSGLAILILRFIFSIMIYEPLYIS